MNERPYTCGWCQGRHAQHNCPKKMADYKEKEEHQDRLWRLFEGGYVKGKVTFEVSIGRTDKLKQTRAMKLEDFC